MKRINNKGSIPVNSLEVGVAIGSATLEDLESFGEATRIHRDDYHLFFLQEEGRTVMEIDFLTFEINAMCVAYIHPNQVHRILATEKGKATAWIINNENLKPAHLHLLQGLTPVTPLPLDNLSFSDISAMATSCLRIFRRKLDKLYPAVIKDSCNALVGLVISQFLLHASRSETLSRYEMITKAFREILELNFASAKRPGEYARQLNISAPYLYECVKNTTGYSVSQLIEQRNILEAKRLLYYSDKSVKEIAFELGYYDFSYFTRLFNKVTGMTALNFRNKNLD
ncbi:MAG TPA: AraC family transcriptional regulator [Bacteroidetes bacterium]|nr:AraC family transcriptional regulator [Bacteroidota bacterium]